MKFVSVYVSKLNRILWNAIRLKPKGTFCFLINPYSARLSVSVGPLVRGHGKQVQQGDPWVQRLEEAEMIDTNYVSMIHAIEAGTIPKDLPNENEPNKWMVLGWVVIFKENKEILVPANERENIIDNCHATHLGYVSMLLQLRRKVFWSNMWEDLRKLARECEPCARHHVSNSQRDAEMSHTSHFDSYPGRDLHVYFATYKGSEYIILIDRLTGYLNCQRTHDQSTSEAILAIWKWSSKFGLPFKVISDGGGGFKNTFIEELKNIAITHHPSSDYNPRSNSLAERGIISVKTILNKTVWLTTGWSHLCLEF